MALYEFSQDREPGTKPWIKKDRKRTWRFEFRTLDEAKDHARREADFTGRPVTFRRA